MTVFKSVLKIVNKYKTTVILYTVMLIVFGASNFKTSDNSLNFVASKPDIYIINNDEEVGITKTLINYLEENTNIKEIKNDQGSIDDALFYRDVNYVIYIPKDFRKDILNLKNPKIEIKTTKDYNSYLAENLLNNYVKTLMIYRNEIKDEEELIKKVEETLNKKTDVKITSKLDTNSLSQVTIYFNFLNYCILAGCVYVICLILSSFKEKNVNKRMIISSTNYKKLNRKLLISMGLITFILWFFYILLAYILLGDVIFKSHGIIYIINSFIFTICALTLAFLIGNLVNSKTAINGIINVVALGSSFLCGAFVPMEWLPDGVLKIAHILPSYYYISSNESLKTLEVFNLETMQPIITNMIVILGFSIIFIILTNIVSKRKQKIG